MTGGADLYKQTQIAQVEQDISPEHLVTMLYDGAIENLVKAKSGAQSTDSKQHFAEPLGKSLSIIQYLQSILDMEQGGEVASRLYELYDYMQARLLDVHVHKDQTVQILDEVVALLQEIRSGWAEMSQNQ